MNILPLSQPIANKAVEVKRKAAEVDLNGQAGKDKDKEKKKEKFFFK